jgi:hypothetical protein
MRGSVLALFPRFYDAVQSASAALYIARLDTQLVEDAEGFTRLALRATLPGEPLYRAFGVRQTARPMLTLPDGVLVEGVAMQRPIT